MVLPIALSVVLMFSLLQVAAPTSASTLYTWRAADGSLMFTDDPRGAPANVQMHVWAEPDAPVPAPTTRSTDATARQVTAIPPIETSSDDATQGEFAARLVEELGLRERIEADDAADLLSRVRIAPRLGRWELERPMTPELTVRLRKLTVASAAEGWIDMAPEEGLLAFDTAAALLGLPIPGTTDFDLDGPWTVADTPALVSVAPPPTEVSSYYVWQSWPGTYWCNGVLVSGVYILDVDRFTGHRSKHRHHHAKLAPDRIEHHVQRQVTKSRHVFKDSAGLHHTPKVPGPVASPTPRVRSLAPARAEAISATSPPPKVHRGDHRTAVAPRSATSNRAALSTLRSPRSDRSGEGAGHAYGQSRGLSRN